MTHLLALIIASTVPPPTAPVEDHVVVIDHNRCGVQQLILWQRYSERPEELHVADWRYERSIRAMTVDAVGDRFRCTFFDESDGDGMLRVVWCDRIIWTNTTHDPEGWDHREWPWEQRARLRARGVPSMPWECR